MGFLHKYNLMQISYAFVLFIIGYIFAHVSRNTIRNVLSKRFSEHQTMLFSRLVFYIIFILFFISGLQQLGFELNVLLGAAGIFTVAISFASQTSASNLISGIFLLIEHPFKIGDNITAKGHTGKVHSIDLLSTKIKTADNTLVRIPNDALLKSDIVNLSYFKIRRADLIVGIAYESDIKKAKELLIKLAKAETLSLKSPLPKVIINNLGDSAIELKLSVHTNTNNLGAIKDKLQNKILDTFNKEGIDIPFPQISVHKVET